MKYGKDETSRSLSKTTRIETRLYKHVGCNRDPFRNLSTTTRISRIGNYDVINIRTGTWE